MLCDRLSETQRKNPNRLPFSAFVILSRSALVQILFAEVHSVRYFHEVHMWTLLPESSISDRDK